MRALAESIDRTIEEHHTPTFAAAKLTELDHAAAKWATHSLQTYDGMLLTKALAISQSMVEFTAELMRRTPTSH